MIEILASDAVLALVFARYLLCRWTMRANPLAMRVLASTAALAYLLAQYLQFLSKPSVPLGFFKVYDPAFCMEVG